MNKYAMFAVLLFVVVFANAKNISKEIARTLVVNNHSSKEMEVRYKIRERKGTGSGVGGTTIKPKSKERVTFDDGWCLGSVTIRYSTPGGTVPSRVIKISPNGCPITSKIILNDSKRKDYAITARVNDKAYDIF